MVLQLDDVFEIDAAATRKAIGLRLPDVALYDQGQSARRGDEEGLYAVLEIRQRDPETIAIRVVLSDGRAFRREVHPGEAEPSRVLAGTLASLVPAIEEATVIADEEDVPLPEALVLEPDERPLVDAHALKDEGENGDDAEDDKGDTGEPDPDNATDDPPATKTNAPALQASAPLEIGLNIGTSALFGVHAPSLGWRGAAGHLGVDVRLPKGLLAGIELRLSGGRASDLRLLRLRSAIAVGYSVRRRAFELPIAALLTVEPWWTRDPQGRQPVNLAEDTPRPLLGVGVRVAPGLFLSLGKDLHLRIGARLEAALSGEPRDGLRRPVVRGPSLESPALTLAGLELTTGLDLTIWLPATRARRPRR